MADTCIAITATVRLVTDPAGFLADRVHVGDTISGQYIYNHRTGDSTAIYAAGPDVSFYVYRTPPYGISLEVNGLTFRTDPSNVDFWVSLENDHQWTSPDGAVHTEDAFVLRSHKNLFDLAAPTDGQVLVDNAIGWQLLDPTATALHNTHLGTHPPNLADFQQGSFGGLVIRSAAEGMFYVHADVTVAERCR